MNACTEKEAAKKWCPHMRKAIVDTDGGLFAGNMSADGIFAPIACCIGSRCMQWRWLDGTSETASSPECPAGEGWEDHGQLSFLPDGHHGWFRKLPDDKRRGYCGLAGKP